MSLFQIPPRPIFQMPFHEVQWYDRNPVSRADAWQGNSGPHGGAQRLIYTCPAGKIAMVEVLEARVTRTVAPTKGGTVIAWWSITPSGGTQEIFFIAELTEIHITPKDTDTEAVGTTFTLFAGDVLRGYTLDWSTDGVVRYGLAYKLTEFDAYLYVNPPKTIPEPFERDVQEPGPRPDPVM